MMLQQHDIREALISLVHASKSLPEVPNKVSNVEESENMLCPHIVMAESLASAFLQPNSY